MLNGGKTMVENVKNVTDELLFNYFNTIEINNGKNTLYVFQGFNTEFYCAISNYLPHLTFDVKNTYPSVSEFINESNQLIVNILQLKENSWIYYEEFCVIYNNMRQINTECNIVIVYNDIFEYYYPIPIEKHIFVNLLDDDLHQREYDEFKLYSDCKQEAECALVSFVNCHFPDDINRDDIIIHGFYEKSAAHKRNIKATEYTSISRNELSLYADMLQKGLLSNHHYRIMGLTDNTIKRIPIMNLLGEYYNVDFIKEDEIERIENGDEYLPTLKKYWGNDKEFRKIIFYKNPGINAETEELSQGIIVSDIIEEATKAQNGKVYSDIIVTAPTGAGKSLMFQLPSIYLSEDSDPLLTIVISPLVVLMADQVEGLEKKGYYNATFINSDISYEERQRRLNAIQKGEYSVVYMSPELLLSYNISNLIGDRKLGLMVIDEAHLVTSWGRDFRVDYWFLGGYLSKLRLGSYMSSTPRMNFPVVCLTATAVYGGNEDVIGDLIDSLNLICEPKHIYIGYIKRDNIDFTVRNPGKISNEEKMNIVNNAISKFAKSDEKTIVYFPFTRQVEESFRKLQVQHTNIVSKVTRFYGSLDKNERSKAYHDFSKGNATVMLATKAFGMGVDISDIMNVYHYAPTGTLADYVQEIGRAARSIPQGHAIIDFSPSDMNSVKRLWGLSSLKNYQLQAILKKLYGMYIIQKEKSNGDRARNLLFSADEFSYLFDTDNIDNTVKSGLMILNTDLKNTYHFNVITVRSKDLLTTQYIMIPDEIETNFLNEFGEYCARRNDVFTRYTTKGGKNGTAKTTRMGDVHEIHLDKLWKDKFNNLSFAAFKFKFFKGELFSNNTPNRIVVNIRLAIHYPDAIDESNTGFEHVEKQVNEIASALRSTFNNISRAKGRAEFEFGDFKTFFNTNYNKKISDNNLRILLDMFVGDRVEDNPLAPPVGEWKFIVKKTHSQKVVYTLSSTKASYIEMNLNRYIHDMKPNTKDNKTYIDYLPIPPIGESKNYSKSSYQQLIASLLQLFDIASYEIDGGYNPQIFVRINDPLKLQSLSRSKNYSNKILRNIKNRHDRAIEILNNFMLNKFTNDERWNIVEQYFLGKDDTVDSLLNIERKTKNYSNEPFNNLSDSNQATNMNNVKSDELEIEKGRNLKEIDINTWDDISSKFFIEVDSFKKAELQLPDEIATVFKYKDSKVSSLFTWHTFNVVIFENEPQESIKKRLQKDGWFIQILGNWDLKLLNEHLKG